VKQHYIVIYYLAIYQSCTTLDLPTTQARKPTMTTPPPNQITQLANKGIEVVSLLRLCHTLEECSEQDRAQALVLLQAYLGRIIREADLKRYSLE
jgi:hypothetical protein